MLDALLKLLEKLTELVKTRKEAEEKILDLVVIPLFKDFKTVHEDYLKLFEDCRRELVGGADMKEIVRQLSKDRVVNEALRRSIASMVGAYADNPLLGRYKEFFNALALYAYSAEWTVTEGSASQILLKALEQYAEEGDLAKFQRNWPGETEPRKILIAATDKSLERLRKAWEDVSKAYSAVHLARAT